MPIKIFGEQLSLKTVLEYDYEQCITECRVNTILTICKCIPFIYPLKMNTSIICDLKNALCMYNNAGMFKHLYLNKYILNLLDIKCKE